MTATEVFNTPARTMRLPLIAALIAVTALGACGLPRSGPSKKEILSGAVENGGDSHVIFVNNHVNRTANFTPAYGFSSEFLNAGAVGADEIRPGDTLGLMIWENVDDGLLVGLGQSSTQLQQLQVDSQGYIFVPYAGRVRAAGNSPDQLREAITQRLSSQTPDRRSRSRGWPAMAPRSRSWARSSVRASTRSSARPGHCRRCWPNRAASTSSPRSR